MKEKVKDQIINGQFSEAISEMRRMYDDNQSILESLRKVESAFKYLESNDEFHIDEEREIIISKAVRTLLEILRGGNTTEEAFALLDFPEYRGYLDELKEIMEKGFYPNPLPLDVKISSSRILPICLKYFQESLKQGIKEREEKTQEFVPRVESKGLIERYSYENNLFSEMLRIIVIIQSNLPEVSDGVIKTRKPISAAKFYHNQKQKLIRCGPYYGPYSFKASRFRSKDYDSLKGLGQIKNPIFLNAIEELDLLQDKCFRMESPDLYRAIRLHILDLYVLQFSDQRISDDLKESLHS